MRVFMREEGRVSVRYLRLEMLSEISQVETAYKSRSKYPGSCISFFLRKTDSRKRPVRRLCVHAKCRFDDNTARFEVS